MHELRLVPLGKNLHLKQNFKKGCKFRLQTLHGILGIICPEVFPKKGLNKNQKPKAKVDVENVDASTLHKST